METDLKPWQCEHCTFLNEATWLVCGMCLKEYGQTNTNGFTLEFPVINPDDVFGLDAAPEYHVQPAVATVSAAAAETTNAFQVFVQPIPTATAANSSAIIPSTTVLAQTVTCTTAPTYVTCSNAYPVSTASSIPFNPISVKNSITSVSVPNNIAQVKYTSYTSVPITTSAALVTNGVEFTTTRRLVETIVPVTVAVTQSNFHVPRVRVINPQCNPSYFTPNSAVTVTSSAKSVSVANFPNFNSCNDDFQLFPPHRTETNRSSSTCNANVSDTVFTMPVYTPTTVFGSNSYNTGAQSSQSNRTETPLTFPSYAGASTVDVLASPVAGCSYTPNNSIAQTDVATSLTSFVTPHQPIFNQFPCYSATHLSQSGRPATVLTIPTTQNVAGVTVTTSSSPNAPPVTSAVNFNGAARVTTAAFAAALVTDRTPGWMCSYCTFINDNLLLRCAVCDTKKPENLPNVQPTHELSLIPDNKPNVVNEPYFECPQCYLLFAQSKGMILVNCGHKFCKNCLRDWISYSGDIQLKCPFKIRGVLCNSLLTNQEICSILNSEYVTMNNTKVITIRSAQQNVIPGPSRQNIVAGSSQANIGAESFPRNIIRGAPQQNVPSNPELIDLCTDSEDEANDAINIPPTTAERNPPAIIGKELNYQELLELEKEELIPNSEVFECTICMTEQNPGDGVVMRDCLHMFCRECLKQAIKCNTDAEMKCPFGDGKTRCGSTIQDREIRALVDADVFEKHLSRSIKEAENKIQNTFHCKTVDCVGWCEYEEEVNEFRCPVCSQTNCINCKAIHTGLDCKQYQINVQLNSANNPEDAKTNEVLQSMLKKGTAMHCPKCTIILSKVTGCDWLRCSMCKTEICWVTRGPRWGPKGHGDVSGGCRCRLNGVACHPRCGNCH